MNLKIWQKILLIVSLPVIFEIVFVATLATLLLQTEQLSDRFETSKSALVKFHAAQEALIQATFSLTNINKLTEQEFSREFDDLRENLRNFHKSLDMTFGVRPELKDALEPVPDLIHGGENLIDRIKKMLRGSPDERADMRRQLEASMIILVLNMKPVSDRVAQAEYSMHVNAPAELAAQRNAVMIAIGMGLIVSLIISTGAGALFFRNVARRFRIIEENAQRVALGQQLQAPLNDDDEIGELDAALHEAANLIEDARKKEFAILEQSVDVLCSLDRRLRIVDVGASVSRAWKYTPDELIGRSVLTLVPELERTRLTTLLLENMASEKEFEFECPLRTGNGNIRDILWKTSWIQADKIFYCVAHDVTERRALARQKQQLISVAGHDLRTPLTSVSSTFSLITEGARGEISEKAQKELTKASQSLERLMELVRDLLDLEKLDAGKMVLEFKSVSALDVCSAAIDSLNTLAQKLNVKIQPPWQDALMLGDERRLVQIMINFLSNAVKFSPRGGTVTVAIKGGDDFVEMSVADQGPGIPAADREMIFEKFHQSKAVASAAPIKSTGLGLAIAKVLTEGHNGTIGVESEVGKGTRFFVRIPTFRENYSSMEIEEGS
ncbi:MAG: PAS domain S-box protein [Cyanobacteria bacterium SZAS LIN-5]|nr:PAS domain S-box protein [Cyanobacteria bacterium SZAS LIN-5]